jgi:hypothetical protein
LPKKKKYYAEANNFAAFSEHFSQTSMHKGLTKVLTTDHCPERVFNRNYRIYQSIFNKKITMQQADRAI